MKTLKFMCMALCAMVLCTGFSSCSKDDDDNKGGNASNPLIGTWKVISSDDMDADATFTFNSNGTVTTSDKEWNDGGVWYTVNGNTLKIDFRHDDYTYGIYSIDGNTAVYQYSWYDIKEETKDGEYHYSMTLQKQ